MLKRVLKTSLQKLTNERWCLLLLKQKMKFKSQMKIRQKISETHMPKLFWIYINSSILFLFLLRLLRVALFSHKRQIGSVNLISKYKANLLPKFKKNKGRNWLEEKAFSKCKQGGDILPWTIITKHSILDVAAALDPPL